MSSERLKTQTRFENIVSGNNPTVWKAMTKGQIKGFILTPPHVTILESALSDDCIDFYYKGLLSIYEGIISVNKKNFSWATVKLYYSVYYFLRSSLCCNKICFVRKEREGYYFENKYAEQPKSNGKPDHVAAIDLAKQFLSDKDFVQSNSINDINPYEWLRHQRENINYIYKTFSEPDAPSFWDTISHDCDYEGIEAVIKTYLKEDIYCFLDEHAVLALPLRRLIITHSDLLSKGFGIIVKPDKESKLLDLIKTNHYLKYLKPFNKGKL